MAALRISIVAADPLALQDRLTQRGHAIVGAAQSAERALALLSSTSVDLVLLDVALGGDREGLELAAELQRRAIPFMLLTAHDDEELAAIVDRHAFERAQRARELEILGHVASGVAHDLNNLLSAVGLTTHMLRQASPSERPTLLDELHDAITLGAKLTTRQLAIVRHHAAEQRELPVNDELRAMAKLARRLLGPGIEIALDLDPQVGSIQIHPGKFAHAILNLALDAERAMSDSGRLSIRSRAAVRDDQPVVVIDVEHTGAGRSSDPGATIVAGIVEEIGGELALEPVPGGGTRIRMTVAGGGCPQ